MSENYSLCCDCLRLNPVHPTNQGFCTCGGETCSCRDCQDVIESLQDGALDAETLLLKRDIVSWTAEGGAVFELTREEKAIQYATSEQFKKDAVTALNGIGLFVSSAMLLKQIEDKKTK